MAVVQFTTAVLGAYTAVSLWPLSEAQTVDVYIHTIGVSGCAWVFLHARNRRRQIMFDLLCGIEWLERQTRRQ